MGNSTKKYWTGLEELHQTPEFIKSRDNEFKEDLPVEQFLNDSRLSESNTGRRDFLKFLGFGLGAATLAACETPVIKSIPYVNKPEEITPGVANWYASTYSDGHDFASILVKTREGRPIHIKGNKQYGIAGGRTNARINASVLSLYDSERMQQPKKDGEIISWDDADTAVVNAVDAAILAGKKVRVLTGTVNSPSTQAAIAKFGEKAGENFAHVSYDAISYSGMLEANEASFGEAFLPDYDFSKAKTIVSVAADFLSEWLFSNNYVGQYIQNRVPENGWMSNHFQFETLMTVTGSNADARKPIKPSQEGLVVASIYNQIARKAGASTVSVNTSEVDELCALAADKLWSDKGQSLVVAGSNSKSIQLLVNGINNMLGNYGSTISNNKLYLKKAKDSEIQNLITEMKSGDVGLLVVYGCNPVYNLHNAAEFKEALEKVQSVGSTIAISLYADETAALCNIQCPDNHYLESWNDYRVKSNVVSLAQPVISNLYNTRQGQESFLRWAGVEDSYVDFMKSQWSGNMPVVEGSSVFADHWNLGVHNGVIDITPSDYTWPAFAGDTSTAAADISKITSMAGGEFEVVLYAKAGIGDGTHTTNPWLQELPDPITKITWDNYITMAPSDVRERGYNEYIGEENPATLVTLNAGGRSITLPVLATPGQKPGTLGIALGYGRGANGEKIGKAAYQVGEYGGYLNDANGNPLPLGANAFALATTLGGNTLYCNLNASIEGTNGTYALATTQTHHTIMDRSSVLRETSLETFLAGDVSAYNPETKLVFHGAPKAKDDHGHDHAEGDHGHSHDEHNDHKVHVSDIDLWGDHGVNNVGHRWGMSIDLNKCIGCGSCVVSCHSENNVPVVGKDEIRRSRDMHWLRIDRYYSSDMTKKKGAEEGVGTIDMYRQMEVPQDNPQVVHMPMMCQHCNHAPCETVCPVAATTHSNEGLNQMTYNRCIGTRYCANNCPYKVRRFNWFNYMGYAKFSEVNPAQDVSFRMVLNPDVTVRARGVMEKCSMCVQRIQGGKLEAKKAGEPIKDGAIQTACAEACPTNAITFGDVNDTKSKVRKDHDSDRGYYTLEEIGVKPNIAYMVKVRNEVESTQA
jgi:molybdopterin-containing oxidoreductase family iron-sulfur binding subunit